MLVLEKHFCPYFHITFTKMVCVYVYLHSFYIERESESFPIQKPQRACRVQVSYLNGCCRTSTVYVIAAAW